MTQSFYSILSLLLSLAVLGVLYYLYRLKREYRYLPWMAMWILFAVHYGFQIDRIYTGALWAWALDRWLYYCAMLVLLYAARRFAAVGCPMPLFAAAAGLGGLWAFAFTYRWMNFPDNIGPLLRHRFLGAWVGNPFWNKWGGRGSLARTILASVGLLFGVMSAAGLFVSTAGAEQFVATGLAMGLYGLLLMAIGMVILAYEGVQRRVEENMMAFSMLNLTASGLQTDADLADMLDKVLERVFQAFQMQQGLIVAHLEENVPATRVIRGLPAEFAEEWKRLDLDRFVSTSVERVGGLLLAPDLDAPGVALLFGQDPSFEPFRKILRLGNVHAMLGITLRTPKRVYGTLLLAHRVRESFSAAEMRLLAGLGVQVGMGIENFLLMRSVSRRSEEMNLLNQTGRAISSKLEIEPLLRLVHSELQKLMDARNLYVAMRNGDEICFELEVEDGRYLPRRSRPAKNALTEYVLRTGQPLLIQGGVPQFRDRHGIELSGRPALSWAGAPIILRGQAVGVLVVQNHEREGAYDQENLEILKIVAAQAAVAIENARLFAGDQKRLRQLTFLHNITRTAISTLDSEDMLSQIAQEIQKNFAYDHIGIGLLDYQTKEVEWKAEAGAGAFIQKKRIPLEIGLIGRVARNGKLIVVNDSDENFAGILPKTRSALCVPITYADQMLGVLNIESQNPGAFHDDDLPILQTLADHLATALHNAFTFNRTQEQAITDGLTGVKTRRFFMESLNAEWKRAKRAGRVFSLLVLDLDRFKQINDTMGHLEGDLVLVRLAQILEQRCRQSNVVARYGGDEFMVLMPEATSERARILAERLRLWVATDPLFAERKLTASFGLATFPMHGQSPEEIIRAADAGLYLSKHQGGNSVSIDEHFRQGQADRWYSHVFSSFLENMKSRSGSTGPEVLESLIQRIEETWQSFPGEPQELMRVVVDGLSTMADSIEERIRGAKGHQQQVTRYALLLARAMNLSDQQKEQIRLAARLHDVGYLAVPEDVLEKGRRLSPVEFAAIHVHAGAGARLLEAVHMAPEVCLMVRHHHESVNGRGYPDGLPGERIPLGARILAIADTFDALISERPYRPARTVDEALDEMERFAGTQFDELLVRTFVRVMKAESGQEVPDSEFH